MNFSLFLISEGCRRQPLCIGAEALAAIITGAATAASTGASAAAGAVKNKKSYKYTSKLYGLQNEYNKEAFERENERQNWLMANEARLRRQSLRQAGYSEADPEGTGVSTPAVSNMDVPTAGQFMPGTFTGYDQFFGQAADSALKFAQAKNINQDTKNKQTQQEILQDSLNVLGQTFEERVGEVKSKYHNLTKENRKLDAEIDKLCEETRSIQLTADFNEETFKNRSLAISEELRKLSANVDIDEATAAIKKVEKDLAESGILLGQNWFGTLVSLAALGKGEVATSKVSEFVQDILKQLISSIPEVLGSTVGGVAKGIINLPGKVVKGVKDAWNNN